MIHTLMMRLPGRHLWMGGRKFRRLIAIAWEGIGGRLPLVRGGQLRLVLVRNGMIRARLHHAIVQRINHPFPIRHLLAARAWGLLPRMHNLMHERTCNVGPHL